MTANVGKRRKKKEGERARLSALRDSGAVSATFHENGLVASVVFAPPVAPFPAPVATKAPSVIQEILAAPRPRTDLDALDDLPVYGDGN